VGAGRTSIGGGSGGACWLTTGALAGLLAAAAFAAGALVTGGTASGRTVPTFGLGGSGRGTSAEG
jgi:hypothetical protein